MLLQQLLIRPWLQCVDSSLAVSMQRPSVLLGAWRPTSADDALVGGVLAVVDDVLVLAVADDVLEERRKLPSAMPAEHEVLQHIATRQVHLQAH